MTDQDALNISIVFKALARPTMVMGVDYNYFYMMSMVVMLLFIYSGSILSFLMLAPIYLIGWILCKIDPYIFALISARASIGIVKNKSVWGCQSYAPF